ncbi:uncharacterized protein LOC113553896 [Rhopalosiphum maidis]|uniref:uncharacterized protein LOC113553896 n=1 Tax=Rhopalosiphum maidis TaxID=43146 RepID=UPI000EFF32FE|nr:uncharacterized protein LOC113553896 [Rhopalosiphum maidis]
MTMLDHSSSHATSDPSLPLMLLLLLLPLTYGGGGNVLETKAEIGQFMDELPVTYRENLELLDNVMALDDEWSPIWNEKLKIDVLTEADLVKEFCPSMWSIEGKVDTLHAIKLVKEHCFYSDMYVAFAVKLIGYSVQCLLNKHASIQLSAITMIENDWPVNEIDKHLERLVEDYHLIADRLATVGVNLTNLISLAKLYDAFRKQLVQYKNNSMQINKETKDKYLRRINSEAKILIDRLDTDIVLYCDEASPTVWYDRDTKKSVSFDLAYSEDEVVTYQTDDPSSSTLPADDVPQHKILKKAHQLRVISRKVFDDLLLGKMSLDVWKQLFENYLLEVNQKKEK